MVFSPLQVGRCARLGSQGTAITFINESSKGEYLARRLNLFRVCCMDTCNIHIIHSILCVFMFDE